MKIRDKFRKKGLAPKGEERKRLLLKEETETREKAFVEQIGGKVKIYKKERCTYVSENGKRCTHLSVGAEQRCSRHGGVIDIENTLSPEATQMYLAISGSTFLPSVHPYQYIDLSRQGCSPVEVAAEMGIGESTLKKWAETYSEMAMAFEIGKSLHESWWLNQGKNALNTRGFNTNLFKYLTGNKLGYSDKTETKSTNMHIHGVLVVPGKQTVDEWENAGQEIKDANPTNPAHDVIDIEQT